MSNSDEQLKIPIGWAATIVSTIVGVAMQAGITHYRVGALESELADVKAAEALYNKTNSEHELKLQRLEITLSNISDKLDGISGKLDKLEERRK